METAHCMLITVFSLLEEDKNVFKIKTFYEFESKMPGLHLWSRKKRFVFFAVNHIVKKNPKTKSQTREHHPTHLVIIKTEQGSDFLCNYILVYAFTIFPTAKGINSQQLL